MDLEGEILRVTRSDFQEALKILVRRRKIDELVCMYKAAREISVIEEDLGESIIRCIEKCTSYLKLNSILRIFTDEELPATIRSIAKDNLRKGIGIAADLGRIEELIILRDKKSELPKNLRDDIENKCIQAMGNTWKRGDIGIVYRILESNLETMKKEMAILGLEMLAESGRVDLAIKLLETKELDGEIVVRIFELCFEFGRIDYLLDRKRSGELDKRLKTIIDEMLDRHSKQQGVISSYADSVRNGGEKIRLQRQPKRSRRKIGKKAMRV